MAETEAFLALSQTIANFPRQAIQRLLEHAMALTQSGSAGVSIAEEEDDGDPVFRWAATAGAFESMVNGTLPRHASPCGAVLDAGRSLVMRDPGRHFRDVAALEPRVRSVLLVPFRRNGRLIGTLWVAAHRDDKWFTADDVHCVESLTTFATTILDLLPSR